MLDEFGKEYAASVEKKVKDETARLQKHHQALTEAPSGASSPPLVTEGQSQQSTVITAYKGRKFVFDNFDYKQQVHSMTEQHQNIDVHWVTHLSVENRADAVMQMENGVCLPTRHEHHLQRENYITLTERATVEIPCLACLKPCGL